MKEIRVDEINNDIVIFAKDRARRPMDKVINENEESIIGEYNKDCPFCKGNEHYTPKSKFKIEDENGSTIMDFYNHVSVLVGSYDESLGAKLMTMMDDLVDICSDLVRRYEDVDNQDAISVHILRHEREVISFLNRGMRVIK